MHNVSLSNSQASQEPLTIALVDFPSRDELTTKSIFDVIRKRLFMPWEFDSNTNAADLRLVYSETGLGDKGVISFECYNRLADLKLQKKVETPLRVSVLLEACKIAEQLLAESAPMADTLLTSGASSPVPNDDDADVRQKVSPAVARARRAAQAAQAAKANPAEGQDAAAGPGTLVHTLSGFWEEGSEKFAKSFGVCNSTVPFFWVDHEDNEAYVVPHLDLSSVAVRSTFSPLTKPGVLKSFSGVKVVPADTWCWGLGLALSSQGLLLPLRNSEFKFHLDDWPDFGELSHSEPHVQLSAFLARGWYDLEKLLAVPNVTNMHVLGLVNACALMGLLNCGHRSDDGVGAKKPKRGNLKPLFSKLRKKLNL